jgi:Mrp family chromosome partitioning ATPase
MVPQQGEQASPGPGLPLAPGPAPVVPPAPPPQKAKRAGAGRSSRSSAASARGKGSDQLAASALRERCRQLYASTFFREQHPVRSLGFTSAIRGEGKTYLARMTATVLADEQTAPITLLECNWDHPTFHEDFGVPAAPGLAEWLRGQCHSSRIRYQVGPNLTVIPAGEGGPDAMRLLRQFRQNGLLTSLIAPNELVVVDLPPIITTGYGALAASLVDALIVVVQSGATPDHLIAEAVERLKGLPIEGLILNQVKSRIPRWVRQLL